jgi:protein gp37
VGDTSIEWTDATWNPVRGCDKISPGCKHCYAETFAERFRGVPGHPYEQGFDLRMAPSQLPLPLTWQRPRKIFVNSMSDLFHKDLPREYVAAVFGVMALAPRHTFQVLTKRADVMLDFMRWAGTHADPAQALIHSASTHLPPKTMKRLAHISRVWPLPNVWMGVSVEDRKYGLPRLDLLREVPAAVRFLSIEPLLEDLGTLDLRGIHWVIVGGESGPKARPCNVRWVRSIVQQCAEAGVPCFVKQLGADPREAYGRLPDAPMPLKDPKGGDWDEWPEDLRVRQWPGARP